MRVVRLANYVAPASGGLRTSLRELGAGYLAAGHEPVLVIPGARPGRQLTEQGLVVTVPGWRVPATGGYRAILARRSLARLLGQLEPDRLEVSDRTTLRWTGAWARARGVRSMMVSHDSLAGLMTMFSPPGVPAAWLADQFNRSTARSYDVVLCTTAWAAAEFRRLGVPNLLQVPLGVDLACFHPGRRDESLRSRLAPDGQALLVHCSRLSPEKRPQRALGALAELRRRGLPAVLVVAGDGPQRRSLQAQARGLPVRFLRHISDRGVLARLLATADVVIAPGPVETFGLSALEALACGTPVVVSSRSALPDIVGPAGLTTEDDDASCADAIASLLAWDVTGRRRLARQQAERYGWPAAVRGFLDAHGLAPGPGLPGVAAASAGDPAPGGPALGDSAPGHTAGAGARHDQHIRGWSPGWPGETPVMRFAALGDSVTLGIGDQMPQGGWRGWAALLAGSLAPPDQVELCNLARSGALVRDVASEQLPLALSVRPALASVLVGVNDTLRGKFDPAAIAADLENTVAALQHAGTVVLTASLPDPGLLLRIPASIRRPLARRAHQINAVLGQLAVRYDLVHVDLAARPEIYDKRMWGVDRLHPSERGHRMLARMFAERHAARPFGRRFT